MRALLVRRYWKLGGSAWRLPGGIQFPKIRSQSDLPEDCLRLFRCPPPVVKVHPVVVPGLCQRPRLLQRENLSAGKSILRAPGGDPSFRPEEQDRGSGEDEILVPSPKWQGKMNQLPMSKYHIIFYSEPDRFSAVAAGRIDRGIGA